MKYAHRLSFSLAVLSLSSMALAADTFMPNGVTKPLVKAEMSFAAQGLVKEVLVKPGDTVKIGQPLVQLDDSIERKQLEELQIEAKSDIKIKAAEADLAVKKVKLERFKEIQKNLGGNDSEVEDAKLAVDIGELSVDLAKQENAQKKAEAEVQQKKIEKMVLTSEINGIVEKIDSDPGEVADPSKPAMVVTDNSKLDVEASLPTAQVNKLKLGDMVEVRFEGETDMRTAKIKFLSPSADAASSTRLLRAEMANADNRPSGMSVSVRLPEKTQTAER